jgi:antitoxin component of RelBE/YafQ-DinJ toxin-antitoxin module
MQNTSTLEAPVVSSPRKAYYSRVKMPNNETVEAIKEIKNPEYRKKTKKFTSLDDLMADLNS